MGRMLPKVAQEVTGMTIKETDASAHFFKMETEQTNATMAMQKDLLEAYSGLVVPGWLA
jgi:hypothetical protein